MDTDKQQIERKEEAQSPLDLYKFWMTALKETDAQEQFTKRAEAVYKIYEAGERKPFNILFANTQTILPAVYNSRPKPDARPQFNNRDEVARQGAVLLERAVEYQFDEYGFDDNAMCVVRDAALVSRGQMKVKYDAKIRTVQEEDPQTGQPIEREEIAWQSVPCEYVPWKHFRHEPCHTWDKCDWVAFELFLTREELEELNPEVGKLVSLNASSKKLDDSLPEAEKTPFKKASVWQIWDKSTRKVIYVTEGYTQGVLAIEDDPLDLLDFFPCPKPLFWYTEADGLTPIPAYEQYRNQADELNRITERILSLTEQVKWNGVYASELKELIDVMEGEDGEFVSSEGAMAAMGAGKALNDGIWFRPIAEIVSTIRELQAQREEIKQTIYELSGIADIMRGATDAQETLGAQEIKANWASLKVRHLVAEVQRFFRDIVRLKTEVIASKFTHETLSYINNEEVSPDVMQLLRGDLQRTYRIDIETDSTIKADLTRERQNLTEFVASIGQFSAAMGPLVQQFPKLESVALMAVHDFAATFNLSKQFQDKLSEFVQGAEERDQQPDPEEERNKARTEESQNMAMREQAADTAKKELEVQGQQIENEQAAVYGVRPGIVN